MNPLHAFRRDVGSLTLVPRARLRQRVRALGNDALEALGRERSLEEDLGTQWRRVLDASDTTLRSLPRAGAPRVLFGTIWGSHTAAHAIESTLAMALRLRGATPLVLACDHALPACEWNPLGNFSPPPHEHGRAVTRLSRLDDCKLCMLHLERSHALPGLERCSLERFLSAADRDEATRFAERVELDDVRSFVFRDVNVGEHAYASLLRSLRRGTPRDDERTRFLARRYLSAAIQVAASGEKLFAQVRPDRFVAIHGVYVTQGTLCELARKRGIHVIVHGQPYRHGTIWLSHRDSYHRTLVTGDDRSWEHFEMTPERRAIAERYLAEKRLVSRDYADYNAGALEDAERIRARLGLDGRPIVTLYTNIPWDAQLYHRSNIFGDMLDWLFDTIRHFSKRPEVRLVVRIHPAESFEGIVTNQPLADEIRREFPKLPENVTLALPDCGVSSYRLGEMSRAALVYGARMGAELVLLGVPVVVAGESFLRGKGFTVDPTSRSEYFELLERILELGPVPETERQRALEWYYHYFFRLMLPFPFYTAEPNVRLSRPRLGFSSLSELEAGRSDVLDLVCRGIVDGSTPFESDAVVD